MNRSNQPTHSASQILNRVIFLTLLLLIGVGGFGLSTVYLRHQTATTANGIKSLEIKIAQAKRVNAELGAQLSRLTTRDALDDLNTQFALGLAMPRESQIVRVSENVEARLYEKTSGGMLTAARF